MQLTNFLTMGLALLTTFAAAAPTPEKSTSVVAVRTPDTVNTATDLTPRATEDAIVYVGTLFSDMFTQTLQGIMDTQDNILLTEEQIGIMADRIVYVTELAIGGSVEVIYLLTGVLPLGQQSDGMWAYYGVFVPVLALPDGWL